MRATAYQAHAILERMARELRQRLPDPVVPGFMDDNLHVLLFGDTQTAESAVASDSARTAAGAHTGQQGAMSAKPEPKTDIDARPATKPMPKPVANVEVQPPVKPLRPKPEPADKPGAAKTLWKAQAPSQAAKPPAKAATPAAQATA